MKILCVITETGLTPKYESDREEFKKLKRNAEVVVEIKKGRNIEFHKKYFALLNANL